jgi:hypothetical protein
VLAHRLLLRSQAGAGAADGAGEGLTAEAVVAQVVRHVAVPVFEVPRADA